MAEPRPSILVAVVMLTVAVGGLLGSSAAVANQMGGGVRQTVAAGVALHGAGLRSGRAMRKVCGLPQRRAMD